MLRCLKVALLVGIVSAAPPVLAVVSAPVEAQVAKSGYALPLSLAMEAAAEAVRTCERNGYAVSAAVVDPAGVIKLQAKGDHSTIHTRDSSFRKAYTVVTLGPIFRFDTSSAFAELTAKSPTGPALSSLPEFCRWRAGLRSRLVMRLSRRWVSAGLRAVTRTRPVPALGLQKSRTA